MTAVREPDRMLRRFERNQVVACLVMAAAAAVAGRVDVALGVVAGGGLMGFSYWAIKGGVDAIVDASRASAFAEATADKPASDEATAGKGTSDDAPAGKEAGSRRRRSSARRKAAQLARFVGRYALLAVAAYVMLACLHTHPAGLLIGAASPVVAAAAEAVRALRTPRPGQSR